MAGKGNRKLGVTNEQKWINEIATKFSLVKYQSKNVEWQIGSSRALSTATDAAGVDVVFNEDVPNIFHNMKIQIKRAVVQKNSKGIKIDPSGFYNIKQSGFRVLLMTVYVKKGKRNEFFEDIAVIKLENYALLNERANPKVVVRSNNLKPEISKVKENIAIHCVQHDNKEPVSSLAVMTAAHFLDLIHAAQSNCIPGEPGNKSRIFEAVPPVATGTERS